MQVNSNSIMKQLNLTGAKNNMISQLKAGDTVRVQVVNNQSNILLLRLPDGNIISATSMIELKVKKGDFIDLSIKEKSQNQTFVEIINLKLKNTINVDIEGELKSKGIIVNNKTINAAKQLIINNAEVNKSNINKLIRFANNDYEFQKIAFLTANKIDITAENIEMINKLSEHKNMIGHNINKLHNLLGKISDEEFKKKVKEMKYIFNQERFNKSSNIKDFIKQLFVNINKENELCEEFNIKNLYEKILKFIKYIEKNTIKYNVGVKEEILNTTNEIEKDILFLMNLDKLFNYKQIPISINGYETTAELYFFRDNNNKKNIDPKNTSIFIALETKNLGTIESYIRLKGNNIECTLRNEDDKVLNTFRAHSIKLFKLLDVYGYKLTALNYKKINRNEEANIINANSVKDKMDTKYSINLKV